MRTADEPEWLCALADAMGKDFWDKPVHCQIAALEKNEVDLRSMFSSQEGNPNALAHHDTNYRANVATARDLPVNLTPTDKPQTESTASSSAVPPSSIPSENGDDSYNNDYEATPEALFIRSRGPSSGIDFSDTGGLSAEFGVQRQTGKVYIPTDQEIKDRLSERLKDNGCKAFLDKFRSNLGINKSFEELLDNALEKGPKNKKGILYDPNIPNAEKSSTGKYNQLTLKPQSVENVSGPNAAEVQKRLFSERLDTYVNLVIHALVHRAGVEGHIKFADAANDALSISEQKDNPLPVRSKKEKKDSFDGRNSDYFMNTLKQKCPGVILKN